MYDAIINPIASVLGIILDWLFNGLSAIGLGNIALVIVLFTIIIKLVMIPLTFQQSKLSKMNTVIMPEVKKIQEKYKDKRSDQQAMMKMQAETKAVYEKYGTSQTGGCIQLLIQFPILMALYRVFQRIPMYVGAMKSCITNILGTADGSVSGIMSQSNYLDVMNNIPNFSSGRGMGNVDWTNVNDTVVAMNSFTVEQWDYLKQNFSSFAQVITDNQDKLSHMNTTAIFGINMSQVPVFGPNVAIIIPILAGISQFISAKIMQGKQQTDDDNPAAASMKMMLIFMPIMSMVIGFQVPAGLGVYWIATAVIQTIMQLAINHYYDKIGLDEIVRRNTEKRNKKLAKKGISPDKIAKNATFSTKNAENNGTNNSKSQQRLDTLKEKQAANDKRIKELKESTSYYKTAKPGSLAEKASMVSKYNDKNKKN